MVSNTKPRILSSRPWAAAALGSLTRLDDPVTLQRVATSNEPRHIKVRNSDLAEHERLGLSGCVALVLAPGEKAGKNGCP
jgi:hypothetical protein